jgi:hypothetical protein
LIFYKTDGRTTFGGGPRYDPSTFEAIIQQQLMLIADTANSILVRFPRLVEDALWYSIYEKYAQAITEIALYTFKETHEKI